MPSYPAPKVAVNPTCTQCGSTVYCGAPSCPSATLQLAPDGVPMNSQGFLSVPQTHYVSVTQSGGRSFVPGIAAG